MKSEVLSKRFVPLSLFTVLLLSISTFDPWAANAASTFGGEQGPISIEQAPSTRVVGGTDFTIMKAPWQVALIDGRSDSIREGFFCGGSILSANWVITAAHCFDWEIEDDDLIVVFGVSNFEEPLAVYNQMPVEEIVIYEGYNSETNENDIALLRLTGSLPLERTKVDPIDLVSTRPSNNSTAQITGWGGVWCNNGSFALPHCSPGDYFLPQNLQGATLKIQSDSVCTDSYPIDFVSPLMICAGILAYDPLFFGNRWTVDTCQGDSGGPLAILQSRKWRLAGITSWGYGCAWDAPGVYTNVANYVNWVRLATDTGNASPMLSRATATNDGFTFNITNYTNAYSYSAEIVDGEGTVTLGSVSRSTRPVIVTGAVPGQNVTVRVTASLGGAEQFRELTSAARPIPVPTLSRATATNDGFTFNITNYTNAYSYSAEIVDGEGTVTLGSVSRSTRPVIVTGAVPGQNVTVRVTASLGGAEQFRELTSAARPIPVPTLSRATATNDGFTFNITNYTNAYSYSAEIVDGEGTVTLGSVSRSTRPVIVTGAVPGQNVTVRVTASLGGAEQFRELTSRPSS